MQRTLAIIKPDAMVVGKAGKILAHLETAGFAVRAAKLVRLSQPEAEGFYAVHRERSFFDSLVPTPLRRTTGRSAGCSVNPRSEMRSTPPTRRRTR
jgi:hypothetical protein